MYFLASPTRHIRTTTRLFAALFATLAFAAPFVHASDGSGTATVTPVSVNAGSVGNTLTFTFTAAESMNTGEVSVAVPSGWSTPQGTAGVAGYTTATSGAGTVATVLDNADSTSGWVAGTACTDGLTLDTGVKQEGTGAIRCTNGNESDGDHWYKTISPQNWTGYTKVGFWIRSNATTTNSGEIRFAYDDNADLATPIEQIVLGQALAANTWTYIVLNLGATTRTSVASFGFYIRNNALVDNDVVWIDDVLIGPGVPTFPSGEEMHARLLQLGAGQTVTLTYGAGGGASGAVAPASGESSDFTTSSRVSDAGTLITIASSPIVTVLNPAPTTTGISPTSRIADSGAFTIAVSGTNFVPASVVRFNDSDRATTYVSATQLTASILAGDVTSPGSNAITVFNPTPGGGTSNAQTLTVTADVTADVTAPTAVTDLALSGATTSSIVLTWTAPGDDSNAGIASLYDIRYSTSPIVTLADFTAASQVSGEPAPSVASTVQTMTVTGLSANTLYFAMTTQDEVPNISSPSNVPSLSTAAGPDVTAPTAVTDLALSGATTSSIVLTWTAPGDDGTVGTAALYDIRYATAPITTASDFSTASLVSGEPTPPSTAGTVQSMTVAGLSANTLYYFAMTTQDEVPNISSLSNVPSLSTTANPDTVPPTAVTDLALSGATTSSIVLTWTAPGDDIDVGTASTYDIRYATSPIVTEADFMAAALVSSEPSPSVAGTLQSMTVGGLSARTTYSFAMKTSDEAPNISLVSNTPSLSTTSGGGGGGVADITPPSAITDLTLSGATASSMVLTWTAPGDDSNSGIASLYDIRYSTSPIVTAADFSVASLVSTEPFPNVAGTTQSMTVDNLVAGTTYYFAMTTRDESFNTSGISNTPSLATIVVSGSGGDPSDTTPPTISAISAASITKNSAIITWKTNENADSLARFGPTIALGGTAYDGALVTVHTLPITGLTAGTAYRYTVCSKDLSDNQGCIGDLNFSTLPATAAAPAYGAAEALAASPTISIDKSLTVPSSAAAPCVSGTLIKQPSDNDPATQADSAVYYCGADGKRYGFPNAGVYFSWYPDFSGVSVVSVAELAAMPFGGNVTYRPGARMIKVQTDPKVYAVAKGGVLRWVTTEAVARALYGVLWNNLISDISDGFFAQYTVGEPISLADVTPITPVPTPVPPTPVACTTTATFTEFLSNGSSDPQVLPLQELLQCLGYFSADIAPNGHFGPETEGAVRGFQTANGIDSFGYVGPATRDALNRYTVE